MGGASVCDRAREAVFRTDELKSKKDEANGPSKGIADRAGAPRGRRARAQAGHRDCERNRAHQAPRQPAAQHLQPTFLADEARKLAKQWKLGVEVLETKQLEALKMASFLNVARGSAQPPRLIVLKHQGGGKSAARRAGRQGHHVRLGRHLDQSLARRWTR